jgi:isoleucyl-tRNA synthetase
MTYRELPQGIVELEKEILRRWDTEGTFEKSLSRREGAPEYVFYEGPPTANGRPGVHHIISRAIKDAVARYRSMTGWHVTRVAGWDTHGLPVEIEAEKQLGISGKPDIERLGVGRFNDVCRENIFTYKEDWEQLSRRIGYWLDYDRPYITCSPEYIESVWWALSEIDRKGLLYKGYKVLPYCPRCGTGLSSHEVDQGYRTITEPSVYAKFHLQDDPDDARVLSWTTTPWTLPGNLALAVGEDLDYARVRIREPGTVAETGTDGDGAGTRRSPQEAAPGEVFILATTLLEETLRHPYEVIQELKGRDLVGLRYRPLFPGAVAGSDTGAAWTILAADFVTDEEGTGVVHTAVMYGEDDFELGRRAGLPFQHTVDTHGRFVERVPGGLAGRQVKDPETEEAIADYLRDHDLLYRRQAYEHSYPHCWRCESALLYMARDSWYIRTTAVKDRLLEHNASVGWHPPEIGSGRMGEWLESNVDWAVSRDRYWGTPLPIWMCDRAESHREVVGSFERLAELAGSLSDGFDPHRPEIDALTWACMGEKCDGVMRRVPEVIDAWFDSGSMPFAQWHYPFEGEGSFGDHFPAHFIAEGVDQTRGWFYSLLAISTLLFDEPCYLNVVVNDLILDETGLKMSKSRGNVVDPWEAIAGHGADAIRVYLLAASNPWLPKRWDAAAIRETNRKLFDTLRSTYRFFVMYAGLEDWNHETGEPSPLESRPLMDRWLLSRLDGLVADVRWNMEEYDLTSAARRITGFVLDDLSNWYVRQTRDRFWATRAVAEAEVKSADAFATLYEALTACALLLAPLAPFLSDWLYRALAGVPAHLADYPRPRLARDVELEQVMEDVRKLATLGRAAREQAGIRVRQPLSSLRAVIPGGRRPPAPLEAVLLQELNVKRVVFPSDGDDIVRSSAKPDYGRLGPRFGRRTPAVARAILGLEPDLVRELKAGRGVTLRVGGEEVVVNPEDVRVQEEAAGELTVQAADGYLVGLDGSLTDELLAEGLAREVVNRVQRLRRDSGLDVSDRIRLAVAGPRRLEEAVSSHRAYIAGETLALELLEGDEAVSASEHIQAVHIEDEPVRLGVSRMAEPGA